MWDLVLLQNSLQITILNEKQQNILLKIIELIH